MYPETKPILFNCPQDFDSVEIYPVHDLHYGSDCFDYNKWNRLRDLILSEPNRYVVWVGDLLENAVPGSKSSVFSQLCTPQEQKDYVTSLFREFKERTIAILDGNHELNRSTRHAGLYPLYDCAAIAGIEDKYRTAYAVIDLGVGAGAHWTKDRQLHYVLYATHKAKQLKNFCTADALEGFDIFLYGHDHEAQDHPRGKLVYNPTNHAVLFRTVECVNCGSFLSYGGYGAASGYRPKADKLYKIVLHGGVQKQIETVGFRI